MVEAHDAFLYAAPNTPEASEAEDAFTLTIPLSSIGHTDEMAMFVATRRRFGLILSERYDIAPPEPIYLLDPSGECDLDVSPAALEFGTVPADETETAVLELGNEGEIACTVTELTVLRDPVFSLNPSVSMNTDREEAMPCQYPGHRHCR